MNKKIPGIWVPGIKCFGSGSFAPSGLRMTIRP